MYGLKNVIEAEVAPKGKRTIRRTIRGSINGYIGGKFWEALGEAFEPHTQTRVDEFLAGQE